MIILYTYVCCVYVYRCSWVASKCPSSSRTVSRRSSKERETTGEVESGDTKTSKRGKRSRSWGTA